MQYFPLILILLVLLVLITRPVTVIFHELGHAVPAILFTKQKVKLYIGSYGDPIRSIKINVGLLEIWFRYNPLSWQQGLCIPTAKNISVNRQIIYTLTGPSTSFFIAFIACYFTFTFDLHGFIKLVLVIFLSSSLFDLIINLIPYPTPIKLYDGTITYNDGYTLKRLFYFKRFPKEYDHAVDLYNQQKYSEASLLFKKMLSRGISDAGIYRLAISSYLQSKRYSESKILIDSFILSGEMTSDDFSNAGLVYSRLGMHDQALEFYDKSLQQNPANKYSLNNKGYTLNLMGRYEEAIPLFTKAIEIEADYAYSYNNRGLAKIKIGDREEGLADINHSFKLNDGNSYCYMNLGIYHFDKGEYTKALLLFRKAKELDDTTYGIDELIVAAEIQSSNDNTSVK